MEGKEVQTEKANNKPLVILLISLLTLIVVIVGIIIVLNNKNGLGDGNLARECLDTEDVTGCLYEKAYNYYENEHDCEKALKVYDDIPAEQFDEYELSDLYNDAYSLSYSCEDESLKNYWEQKFNSLSSRLEGRN